MIKNFKNFLIERSDSSDGVESISDICKKYNIKNYTINEDGSVDVDGNVFFFAQDRGKKEINFS